MRQVASGSNRVENHRPGHQFPVAAVTNGHTRGSKRQQSALSQLWRPEVQDQLFHEAKVKVKVPCFLQKLYGRIHFLPPPASGGF